MALKRNCQPEIEGNGRLSRSVLDSDGWLLDAKSYDCYIMFKENGEFVKLD